MTTTADERLGADAASTLFVSDLDFTLLGSDALVSARTVQVINALVERGLRFTYATARSHRSATRATSGLRLDLPVITYGGTMTVDPVSGVPHEVRTLPAETTAAILRFAHDERDLQPLVHTFSGGRDAISWLAGAVSSGVAHFVDQRPGDPRLAPVTSWSQVDLSAAYYVSIIGRRDEVAALAARLRDRLDGCLLILSEDPYAPGVHWLEIHSALGSKASAARELADRLGMTRLVAFGDNHNDVPLFEVADEAYAVSNAVPELRHRATGIIGDNDTHAVAEWLAARFGT